MKKTLALTLSCVLIGYTTASGANSCSGWNGDLGLDGYYDSLYGYDEGLYFDLGYGGVSLSKTADLLLAVTDIEGAAYDQATGQIIFYGKQTTTLPAMRLDDVAVAIRSVYGLGDVAAQNPGVSIGTEPSDIPDKVKVRYDGATANTAFGKTMFDADRLLKSLTLGRDNETLEPVTVNIPGYKSYFDLTWDYGIVEGLEFIWFEPERISLKKSVNGDSMTFDEVSMKTFAITYDPVTGEQINPTVPGQEFADFLTLHYDEIAVQYPVLKELKRLGKITSVVKWIQENQIPLDLSFVEGYQPEFVATPDYTAEATVTRSDAFQTLTLKGGIWYLLNADNFAQTSDLTADQIMDSALNSRPTEADLYWNFQDSGQNYVAITQSLSRSKKDGNVTWSTNDISFPARGDLSLNYARHYDSFNDQDHGFGRGWYPTPMGLRFPGIKLNITFNFDTYDITKVAHYDFYFRTGSRERLFTVTGLDDAERLVYLSEDQRHRIVYDDTAGTYTYENKDKVTGTFDETGVLLSFADRNNQSLQYTYATVNGRRVLSAIAHSNGRSITFGHDAAGRIASSQSPSGEVVYYSYDVSGRLTQVQLTAGTQTYEYDTDGRLSRVLDSLQQTVIAANFDDYNRAQSLSRGTTSSQTKDFNLAARRTDISTASGMNATHWYDEKFRLLTTYDNLNRQIDYEYQSVFGPTSVVDPRGAQTHIGYDGLGNVSTITSHYSDQWLRYYNSANLLAYIQDPSGWGSYTTYNTSNRPDSMYHVAMLSTEVPGQILYDSNIKTSYVYDQYGNVTEVVLPDGARWQAFYNVDGQPVQLTSPTGRNTYYEYNPRARLVRIRDDFGEIVSYTYNSDNTLASITRGASTIQFTYDANGNLLSRTDGRGSVTQFNYDENNRLVRVVDALLQTTLFTYDTVGNLVAVTLPNGDVQQIEHDIAHRVTRELAG